jgi:hypothetical protein
MRRKEIDAAIRDYERQSTQARRKFEQTGNPALLDKIAEIEQAIDRLVLTDPED